MQLDTATLLRRILDHPRVKAYGGARGWLTTECDCSVYSNPVQMKKCRGCKTAIVARYTGPHLTTDRVAAFTSVTPVLEACECVITTSIRGTIVDFDGRDDVHYGISGKDATDYKPYPAATTAAIAWLSEHEPERLRKAVEGVK